MLASLEARRNNALREIDRHRDALGGGVRRSIEEIEDAEFRDVETGRLTRGRNLDHRPPTARELRQCEIEHRAENSRRKGASAQNAFRHGLNVPVSRTRRSRRRSEAMARKSPRPDEDGETLERARRIAEAQVDLNRVRNSRRQLITRLFVDPDYQPLKSTGSSSGRQDGSGRLPSAHAAYRDAMRLGTCFPRNPLKVRKSLRLSSRKKFQSLRYSIGTSDALCRDAKPRSAILTRLEHSPSRSGRTKFKVDPRKCTRLSNQDTCLMSITCCITPRLSFQPLHFWRNDPLMDRITAPSMIAHGACIHSRASHGIVSARCSLV